MCGRYTAAKDFSELIKLVGVVMAQVPFFAPRYNIAPTQMAAVMGALRLSWCHLTPRLDWDLVVSAIKTLGA